MIRLASQDQIVAKIEGKEKSKLKRSDTMVFMKTVTKTTFRLLGFEIAGIEVERDSEFAKTIGVQIT